MDSQPALTVEMATLSLPGGRNHNEDTCGHWSSERYLCCVVADGAGGHGGGEVASRLAARHILSRYAASPALTPEQVHDLLIETNAVVIRHRADAQEQATMHSTVVCMFVDLQLGTALWAHAGDSRLYLFIDGQMLARTRDHSVVQSLVDAKVIGDEQMLSHPFRSELLSALGSNPEQLHLTVASKPWRLHAGDVFLLCTDGLWEYVSEAEMCASLKHSANPQAWLAALEQLVYKRAAEKRKVNHDNFSAISVWFRDA
jgi:serine/threonine protein phosphatase PrpC